MNDEIDAAAAIHLETALFAAAAGDTPRALGALLSIDRGSWEAIRDRLTDPMTYALLGDTLAQLVDQMPPAARAILLGPAVTVTATVLPAPVAHSPEPSDPAASGVVDDPADPGVPAQSGPERGLDPEPYVRPEELAACFGMPARGRDRVGSSTASAA